jgi:hypothetical protein
VKKISKLGTARFFTLIMQAICSSETSVPITATRRHIHKTAFFIVAAIKASNLTQLTLLYSIINWNYNYNYDIHVYCKSYYNRALHYTDKIELAATESQLKTFLLSSALVAVFSVNQNSVLNIQA